ncbi:cysteine desulfurase family protein [Clostridium sp.]|uniref:cysteine desulfurase family protein n=1 Tax=Clostridium sp. TaxID=1506 RepID=UPI00346428CF
MIYLDNAATTKPYDEVIEEMSYSMKNYFGNPSSPHKLGMMAEKKLNYSRELVGRAINASKEEIIFTSGGSESNNFFLRGFIRNEGHLITTEIEHSSVLKACKILECQGIRVTYLKVNDRGLIDLEELKNALTKDTFLVSIIHVNNEIGSIQPIEEIGEIIKSHGRAKFHVDATQGFGKVPIDVKKCNIDLLSASGHKIHGPRGVGIAYMKKGLTPSPLIAGGGQELGLRAGTENLPAIMALGKATEIITGNLKENYKKVSELKEYFINNIKGIEGLNINSPLSEDNSPYILNLSFSGVRGEVFLHLLEDKEIYVSTASACSSKDKKYSHVLKAIGLSDSFIEGTLRFSFSEFSTKEEVDKTIEEIKVSLKFLRRIKR